LLRVAERTAAEAPGPWENQTFEERLDQVTRFLTQKGYAARWENCEGHYELHACNCPYSGVAEEHPELCMMDHAVISKLLPEAHRADVIRLQSHALDGANRCTYILKPSGTPVIAPPVEGN
jgi:predicted ArsR family transcriptional regulator